MIQELRQMRLFDRIFLTAGIIVIYASMIGFIALFIWAIFFGGKA